MNPDVSTTVALIDWIIKGGAVMGLLLVLFGGYYEFWYYGPAVRRERSELLAQNAKLEKTCEEWKTMTVELLQTASRMVRDEEHTTQGRRR